MLKRCTARSPYIYTCAHRHSWPFPQAQQLGIGRCQERAAFSAAPPCTAPETASAQLPDWLRVLAALRMTDRQLHYLKLLRDRHRERLRALLSARQTLSLEVRRLAHCVLRRTTTHKTSNAAGLNIYVALRCNYWLDEAQYGDI